MRDLLEFIKIAWAEKHFGVLVIVILFVVGSVCSFARFSIPSISLEFPQPLLGGALFAIGIILILIAFAARRSTAVSDQPDESVSTEASDRVFPLATESRETQPIQFRITGDGGDGIAFWNGIDRRELRIGLDVCNFTLSQIKVVCVVGELQVANGYACKFKSVQRITIGASSRGLAFLSDELSQDSAKRIESLLLGVDNGIHTVSANLTISVEANRESREYYQNLTTGNFRFVNFPPVRKC